MPTAPENLLEALFDRSPESILVIDTERRIELVNPAFTELLGYSLDEIAGKRSELLYADDDGTNENWAREFACQKDKRRVTRVVRYRTREGQIVYGQTVGSVIHDRKGAHIGYLGLIRDVSAEVRLEQALAEAHDRLRQREQRFRTIYERTPAMLHSVDREGRIIEVSEHWLSVMGYTRDAVIGRRSTEFLTPDSRRRAVEEILPRFWDEGRCADIPYQMVTATGDILDVQLSGAVEYDDAGRPVQSLAIIKDVTALRRAERRLMEEKERAQTANAAKSRFLATISHEIRTPLNGILGMAESLAASKLDATQQDRLGVITSSGSALLKLLNDLIDLSRCEAGRMTLEETAFVLEDLAEASLALHRPAAEKKSLALFSCIASPACGRFLGDPLRLRQILDNLLSNAIKFTRTGSVSLAVNATTLTDGRTEIAFRVEDTGIGLAPADRTRLFERFERAGADGPGEIPGSGLGLSISQELANLMDGEISVESEPDAGSAFTFRVALARAPGERMPEPAPPDSDTPLAGRHFLVVDDHPTNHQVARVLLEPAGAKVMSAHSGPEAIAAIDRQRFDAVLMDVEMPGMDGVAAARRIRATAAAAGRPCPSLIAVSAHAPDDQKTRLVNAGLDAYIAKPVSARALLDTLLPLLADATGSPSTPGGSRASGSRPTSASPAQPIRLPVPVSKNS